MDRQLDAVLDVLHLEVDQFEWSLTDVVRADGVSVNPR